MQADKVDKPLDKMDKDVDVGASMILSSAQKKRVKSDHEVMPLICSRNFEAKLRP